MYRLPNLILSMNQLAIILVLILLLQAKGTVAEQCSCLNGGACNTWGSKRSCNCLPGFIGRSCEASAVSAGEKAERIVLSSDYSYLYFYPKERNYFKLIIEICMVQNSAGKNSILYLETEDEEGGWKENHSFLETTKIVLQDKNCTILSTHYMSTSQNMDGTNRKVVIGLKIMQDDEAAKYLDKLFSHEKVEGKKQLESAVKESKKSQQESKESQQVTIRVRYQTYASRADYGENVVAVSGCILLLTLILLLALQTRKAGTANRDHFIVLPRLSLAFHRYYTFRINAVARKQQTKHNSIGLMQIFMPAIQYRIDSLLENEHEVMRDFRQDQSCSICLADFRADEKVRLAPCRHLFHQECIDAWCKSSLSCPICRRRLDFSHFLAEDAD